LTYHYTIDTFKRITIIIEVHFMVTVTVSPKFQVVIPRAIRKQLELKPGQKLQILNYGDRIEFLPIKDIKQLKGFLKGIDTAVAREKDRT